MHHIAIPPLIKHRLHIYWTAASNHRLITSIRPGSSIVCSTKLQLAGEEIEQSSAEGLKGHWPAASTMARGKPMAEEGEELPDWLRDLQASLPIEPEPEPIPIPPQPMTIQKLPT